MLSDVITDLRGRLVAAGVTAPLLLGKRNVSQHGQGGNRIVLVPNEDEFGGGSTFDFNGKGNQKPLLNRAAGAEVHIWGTPSTPTSPTADVEALASAEALLHVFIRELRAIVRGQWRPSAGRWNNDTKDLAYGAEYVLQITIDVPVVALPLQALPAGTQITTTLTQGSTSEVG